MKGRVVLVGGGFDIIHVGHVEHLRSAKKRGDVLVVHITGDIRYTEKKGRQPTQRQQDRAKVVSAIKSVDYVFVYNGRHYDQKVISEIKPDILFFNKEGYTEEVREEVQKLKNFQGDVIVVNLPKKNSSSEIKKLILGLKNN